MWAAERREPRRTEGTVPCCSREAATVWKQRNELMMSDVGQSLWCCLVVLVGGRELQLQSDSSRGEEREGQQSAIQPTDTSREVISWNRKSSSPCSGVLCGVREKSDPFSASSLLRCEIGTGTCLGSHDLSLSLRPVFSHSYVHTHNATYSLSLSLSLLAVIEVGGGVDCFSCALWRGVAWRGVSWRVRSALVDVFVGWSARTHSPDLLPPPSP
jgi:hypothetical protein